MQGTLHPGESPPISFSTHIVPSVSDSESLYWVFPSGIVLLRDGIYARGVRITFKGASPKNVEPSHPTGAVFSRFIGDGGRRFSSVPGYGVVAYRDIYPDIDLIFTATEDGALEFQWVVKPGGEPSRIAMEVRGGEMMIAGREVIVGRGGEAYLRLTGLRAYQGADEVAVGYSLTDGILTYDLGEYDGSQTLVIDPDLSALEASSLLGGSYSDGAYAVAVAGDGSVYLAGRTRSPDFPVGADAYDGTYDDSADVFVARMSADLTTLLAATFLGGNDNDLTNAIALAGDGSVYVVGQTASSDFPTTPGAYDTSPNGWDDAFVSKLGPNLDTLLASTLLGGIGSDVAYAVEINSSGDVYVAGGTGSSDFPTTPGAYDETYDGGRDVFVSVLGGELSSLRASTFLAGNTGGYEYAYAMALDSAGRVYLTGYTTSLDFPTTSGAYDTGHNGGSFDVFVSALSSTLTDLVASTYLGGGGAEYAYAVVPDGSGGVYVAGYTQSSDFPTTSDAYDATLGGAQDAFVSLFDGELTGLRASTLLGGSSDENAFAILIDEYGNLHVAGWTTSPDFPTTPGAYDETYGGASDGYLCMMDASLTTLRASTLLGGGNYDVVRAMDEDTAGNIYLAGWTASSDFPTTPGAYDTSPSGGYDAFVALFSGATTRLSERPMRRGWDYSLSDGSVVLRLEEGAYVGLNVYSADGRTLERVSAGYLPAGEHVLRFPSSRQPRMLRLRVGDEVRTVKLVR